MYELETILVNQFLRGAIRNASTYIEYIRQRWPSADEQVL